MADPNPSLSIAMCTFNGEAYLQEQLDSILAQDHESFELVIVDDASSDGTPGLLRKYAARDPRIRLAFNEVNLGYNRNFEKAFSLCRAERIAVSDQDDVWERSKLRIMMANWPPGAEYVFSLSGDFDSGDYEHRRSAPRVYYHDIHDTHQLVFNSPVHGHASMFTRALFEHCRPFPHDIYYDWWMSMHAASRGTIHCIPETLTWHRVHHSNSSRDIMLVQNAAERDSKLRAQAAYFIETFMATPHARPAERESLLHYASLLKKMDGKSFSSDMFRYVMKNRHRVFHYKKKPLAFFSHLKRARKMARKGLL